MTDVINDPKAGDVKCNDTSISISSANHAGTTMYICLYDYDRNRAYTIPAALYNDVLKTVSEVIHLLVPGEIYTVEIIYGKALWGPLTDGEKRMAGRCLAHMVANRRLPLRFVGCPHEHPKKYRLH
jgi:hypothetical protein